MGNKLAVPRQFVEVDEEIRKLQRETMGLDVLRKKVEVNRAFAERDIIVLEREFKRLKLFKLMDSLNSKMGLELGDTIKKALKQTVFNLVNGIDGSAEQVGDIEV